MDYFDKLSAQGRLCVAEDAVSGHVPNLTLHASPRASSDDIDRISRKLRYDRFYSTQSVVVGVSGINHRALADRLPIWC